MPNAPYFYKATLKRVVDGDTVDVDLDLGFNVSLTNQRIRFYGVNAPESRTKNLQEKTAGKAAKARLKELLENADLHVHSFGKGKYGRILGVLYNGKKNIFTIMLKEGHLREYDGGKREPWF